MCKGPEIVVWATMCWRKVPRKPALKPSGASLCSRAKSRDAFMRPPSSPASSSSASEAEDTSHESDQANEPPPYVDEEPRTDYIRKSTVEERDLKYSMDIVTLADATPPVD